MRVAYTYKPVEPDLYGLVETNDSKNIYGKAVANMRFPCPTATIAYPINTQLVLGKSDFHTIEGKKPISEYTKYDLNSFSEKLPLKDDCIVIKDKKIMEDYLTFLLIEFNYFYTLKKIGLAFMPQGELRLTTFRAKDVLLPEYGFEDCTVSELSKGSNSVMTVVFSNVKNLMDIDGEGFVDAVKDCDAILNYIGKIDKMSKKITNSCDNEKFESVFIHSGDYKVSYHGGDFIMNYNTSGNSVVINATTTGTNSSIAFTDDD